jgi:hypothetical protein
MQNQPFLHPFPVDQNGTPFGGGFDPNRVIFATDIQLVQLYRFPLIRFLFSVDGSFGSFYNKHNRIQTSKSIVAKINSSYFVVILILFLIINILIKVC